MHPQARAAIAKALELDPDLSEARATSGWLKLSYDWDWAGAEREYQRAIELNPNNSMAHRYYAQYFRLRKRFDEALEENRRAIDLAPLDLSAQLQLASLYHAERLGDKEIEQCKRVLEMDPTFTAAYINLGGGYELKGQWAEAIAAYEHLRGFSKVGYLSGVAHVWAQAGNRHQAEAALAELIEFSRHNYVNPLFFAEYYAHFGTRDQAYQWLERAYLERAGGMVAIDIDDCYDNLRSDPRFQDLRRRVGF
jgi:tetratricopeptide (TPR) repeat protein